jgi:G-protein alpha subunit
MPGVLDNEQARRASKAIDDEIKVALTLFLHICTHISSSSTARKGNNQEEAEAEERGQRCVTYFSAPLFFPVLLALHFNSPPVIDRYLLAVMLLGQAESGKSTLQKQFQLYHASQTLDRERPSWRPIVYFNAVKAVRTILDEIDWDFTTHANREDEAYIESSWPPQISRIRHKLLPLVTLEDSLASELSGGVTVSGGRSGVFVRAGWQSIVTSTRSWPVADIRGRTSSGQGVVANMAACMLAELQYDVAELWQHPAVKTLLRMRRLRLEESAALFAHPPTFARNSTHITL